MGESGGDKIIIGGMALLVLVLAGFLGVEAWHRMSPAPKPAATTTSAPENTKPVEKPAPEKAPTQEPPPSWERHAG